MRQVVIVTDRFSGHSTVMNSDPCKEPETCSFQRTGEGPRVVNWPLVIKPEEVDDSPRQCRYRAASHLQADSAMQSRGIGPEAIEQLVQLLAELQTIAKRPRLAIKVDRSIVFADVNDITAVEAEGNYVLLHGPDCSLLARESISAIEKHLLPYGFVRIHRSVLVNAAFVEEIHPCVTGEYVLRLKGGKEFRVTRTYKKKLKSLAPLWIGSERLLEVLDRQELIADAPSESS